MSRTKQYTIRNIPKPIDKALRKSAQKMGKSLNQAAIEALARGLELTEQPVVHHNLDFIAGTWVEDPEFDAIIREQQKISPEDWRF
jgi:hypothetical protein